MPGAMLDYYLGQGYYRMNQDLFTCRFLPLGPDLHTVHWLRLVVPQVQYGPKQRQLLRRNERFAVAIKPLQLSAEHEALYARYYQSLDFDTAATLEALLLDGAAHSVFTSYVIEVRDAGQLIAAGIFDHGQDSIAGIVNFYDPAYRQYSLGKYLMLRKTEYARQQRLAHYYPGYLVQGYPKFDYKLFACEAATEVFDCLNSEWLPFSWPEVARQSAALVAERYLRDVFGEKE
ncbi:GNAT family N-acetyltransferase [Hymenobacter sp. RP-2-7]|uniref:GNAT family N-acetyltransferase n=1 Tax=Hymenobacter polaris TaxID=2682546 RepID=A0A7Y0FNT3_9BACT|nr:GNAT family N-acetyltransferase [Hymenobacter polaris]